MASFKDQTIRIQLDTSEVEAALQKILDRVEALAGRIEELEAREALARESIQSALPNIIESAKAAVFESVDSGRPIIPTK